MLKRLALVAGLSSAFAPATATGQDILAELEAAGFWDAEDYDHADSLKARVAADGVVALYASKRSVHLDAEDLAEGGLGDGLLRIGALARNRGLRLDSFATLSVEPAYVVSLNGRDYTAYDGMEAQDTATSWPLATETFFRMINDGLSVHTKDRAFALYRGNDLAVIFLDPSLVPLFDAMPVEERPYTPTRKGPFYGFGEGIRP